MSGDDLQRSVRNVYQKQITGTRSRFPHTKRKQFGETHIQNEVKILSRKKQGDTIMMSSQFCKDNIVNVQRKKYVDHGGHHERLLRLRCPRSMNHADFVAVETAWCVYHNLQYRHRRSREDAMDKLLKTLSIFEKRVGSVWVFGCRVSYKMVF